MNQNDQEYLVQKIRTQYTEREHTELDALKALDRKVQSPVKTFSYVFGSVAALIMGAGMSLVMTDIGASIGISEPLLPGVIVGVVGMAMAILNYPIYKAVLSKRRKQYAAEIVALSDKIMKG